MKEEPDHASLGSSETMVARLEIEELGDPARERQMIEAVVALEGVVEAKIEKGALHISYDPLATTEKKLEQAVRGTGSTVKAAATETAHPELPHAATAQKAPVENARDDDHS